MAKPPNYTVGARRSSRVSNVCCELRGPSLYYVSIFVVFLYPTLLISINTVLNVSKTDQFLDPPTYPPTQSFCWRNIGMVPGQATKSRYSFFFLACLFFTLHSWKNPCLDIVVTQAKEIQEMKRRLEIVQVEKTVQIRWIIHLKVKNRPGWGNYS